jgi:predicted phage terminase large subunit-like protein
MGFRDLTPRCHLPISIFLDDNPSRFKLLLIPRGHYKTSLATISRVTQKVVRDPNQRVLLVNETTDNAENFLSAIEQQFESNRILRTLYSEVIPKNVRATTWNQKNMRLVRQWNGPEETITAMGMTSALTSRHYTHITVDDPISEEAVKSPGVMEDAITRISKFISLMTNPERDTFDLIGTRWALHDVYSFFMKSLGDKLARYVRGAISNGEPIFPELISLATLAQAREMYGEYMFSCLYMNNPRDVANQDFNVNDLRFWRWSSDEESVVLYGPDGVMQDIFDISTLDITVSVDLAVSERITDDKNAIVTVGVTPKGQAVVLDTWVKRCTPLEVIERLFWLKARYDVRQFGIESVAYQKAFKYFLRAECERRDTYMNIVELKAIPSKRGTGNNSKEMRIRGLQPIAASGRLYILPTQHELRNELADFPLGEHDDCIDALAHQLTMWRGYLSPERMERYRESEARLIARINSGLTLEQELFSTDPRERPHPDDLGIEIPQFNYFSDYVIQ